MSIRRTNAKGREELNTGVAWESLRQHWFENVSVDYAKATEANSRATWYFHRVQDIQ